MSRLVLSQITIKKERSINSTTWYYLLQPSNASAPDSTNYGNPPPIYSDTGYSGWSTTEPTYTVGDDRVLYTMVQTLYSDNTFSYSTPTISSSYEAAKDAYSEAVQAEQDILELQELGLASGYIWDNMTYVAPTSTIPVYPIGSYIASGTLVNGSRTITRSNSKTYGLNTWISTGGINLRYNAIDLMKLTTSNLEFYYPSTSSQGTKAISLGTNGAINSLVFYGFNNSNKTMELTNNALNFYNPADGSTLLSSLTSNGLILSKGGIVVGSYNSSASDANQNFVYLSSQDYGTGIQIGNSPSDKTDWRQIIGNKFGVDKAGNLYAAGAHIDGDIIAQSLTIGSGANAYSGIAAINISGYSIEIEVVDIVGSTETKKLIPHLYHNGMNADSEVTDVTKFLWYIDNNMSVPGTAGLSPDGYIIGEYGHTYKVIYDFEDGVVGSGSDIQTRTVDPQKYITRINANGITIHPETQNGNSSIRLDGTGLTIYDNDGAYLAKYGSTITLGNAENINNNFNIKITNTVNTEDTIGNRGPGILLRKGTTVVNEITENGMKIYGLYIPSGSQVYNFGQLANFGGETKIGATNYTKINENQIGFYKENNICLGKIDFTEAIKNDCIYNFSHNWADKTQLTDIYTETISSYDGLGVTRVAGRFQYILSPAGFGEGEFDFDITQSKVNTYTIGNWFTMNIGVLSESTVVGGSLNQEVGYSATTNNIFRSFKINFVVYYDTYSQGPHYIFGKDVDSIGQYSFAMGNNTIAREDCQLAIGNFNISTDDAAFVIGNGTDNNNRSNSFVIYNNGNLEVPNDFKIINHENIDNYLQLNSTGLAVFQRDDAIHPVTTLGSDVYIGRTNSSYLHVNENGLYIKDSGIPIFQIITEKIINGPTIDVVLYDNYTSSRLIGYNYSNIDYTYSPKETKIYFNDGGLQDNDSFVIDFTYKGMAEKYNSNQNKYQYTSVSNSVHTSFNYTADKGELQYYNIIYALDGYNSTLGRVQYYGGNEIIFKNYSNHYNPRNSTSLTIEYYQNIKITSNQQLANVPIITIGPQELSHAEIDYHSFILKDAEQNEYFHISDLRDTNGMASFVREIITDGVHSGWAHLTFSSYTLEVYLEGVLLTQGVDYYDENATVVFSSPPTAGQTLEIIVITASDEAKAFTFGSRSTDLNHFTGAMSIAAGKNVASMGFGAVAEGEDSVAWGDYSHAHGKGTIATFNEEFVVGRYNEIVYQGIGGAFTVGNGSSDSNRSNALTVDWNGNVWAAGEVAGVVHTYGAITGGTWSSKSIGTGTTWKELANFTIPEDGVWLLIAELIYASNATGHRTMSIATSSATPGVGIYSDRRQAVNGTETPLRVVAVVQGNTKYYVNTYHGASTAISCQGRYTAFKIGNSVNKIGG